MAQLDLGALRHEICHHFADVLGKEGRVCAVDITGILSVILHPDGQLMRKYRSGWVPAGTAFRGTPGG